MTHNPSLVKLEIQKEQVNRKVPNSRNDAVEGSLARTGSFSDWANTGLITDKSLSNTLALHEVPQMVRFTSKNPVHPKRNFITRANNNVPSKTWKNPNNDPPKKFPADLKRKAGNELEFLPRQKPSEPSFNNNKNDAIEKLMESLVCDLCQVICSGPLAMEQHLKGRPHKAKLEFAQMKRSCAALSRSSGKPRCKLCQIWCTNMDALEMHFKGQKHKHKVQELESCKKNEGAVTSKRPIICELCLVHCMNEDGLAMHVKGRAHAAKLELKRLSFMQ